MEDLHIVTVVTHDKYYFPYLKESCKRHGKELTVLGYGQKWTGFTMRFNLVINYLKKLKSTDIVCFIDGYDVICTRNLNELKNEFIKLKNETNCKIVIGHDKIYKEGLFYFINFLYVEYTFGKCKNINLNAGTYIGYAKDLLDVLLKVYTGDNTLDDQIILTDYCNKTNEVYIDVDNKLFLTLDKPCSNIDDQIEFKNNNVIYNHNRPFFLHGPGHTYLENTLRKLNYQVLNNDIQNSLSKVFKEKIFPNKNNILIIVVLFLIFTLIYKKLFNFKI